MKFHLPKKLMMAVLAAMSASTVHAGYYTIGQKFHVDAGTPIEQATISAATTYSFNTMNDSREHRVNVGASYTF